MWIRTGNGGVQNFILQHCGSTQCKIDTKKKKAQESIKKNNRQNVVKWCQPRAPIVLPTITAPISVHPTPLPGAHQGLQSHLLQWCLYSPLRWTMHLIALYMTPQPLKLWLQHCTWKEAEASNTKENQEL